MPEKQQAVTDSETYNYLLHLPEKAQAGEQTPLIVFLHGAGEKGHDLAKVKAHGIARIVEEHGDFPFITVSPQCPPWEYWRVPTLRQMLDDVIRRYPVDEDRIYLTGLSMGGYGTWMWACAEPLRFAAIAPVCGGGERNFAHLLKEMPIWAFHGALDDIVPLSESEAMIGGVTEAGGTPRFTVYPQARHDSWTETYSNPELYRWFLQHRRSQQSRAK